MRPSDDILTCAQCGERIGVYEPLWHQLGDGEPVGSSYLALADAGQTGSGEARAFHAACLPPAAIG